MADNDNIECDTCGGTDFYKEYGYFYCKECQTQSQEVREHEFEEEVLGVKDINNAKKIKKSLPDESKNKLTSWECYNVVMSSLTQQLINLGANKNLRPTVKCLWMRYLEKMEVLHLDCDEQPKLQLVNAKKDVGILYGHKAKKKKRKKSISDESATTLDGIALKKERSRKKRALVQAHCEEFAQKSTQETPSLHNETLASLKSSSEKSGNVEQYMKFNRYSIKELRKTLSKSHCTKHKLDKQQNMTCHKMSYKNCSGKYFRSVHYVSPLRLYCILYLGLLIVRDQIQLGDLFRFIREGHLSFNNYTQLFPESYSREFLNMQNNKKNCMFTSKVFRIATAKIASFLDVVQYIKFFDLTQLCQRFCTELNLPDEIFSAVKNFISRTQPKFNYTKKTTIIPNYEGRAVSFILFTLKLLFGLDGVTEFELSKYAQLINDTKTNKGKMFDISKWIEYIGYRNLIICEYNFPYHYYERKEEINSDLFLQYTKSRDIQLDENIKITKEMSDYKDVLLKIKELQDDVQVPVEFPASLTPFRDYVKVLIDSGKECYSKEVLSACFEENSVDFLLRPNKYLQLVGKNVTLKHGGANDNWKIVDIKSSKRVKSKSRKKHNLIPVAVPDNGFEKNIDEVLFEKSKPQKIHDASYVQRHYQECRQHIFNENKVHINKVSSRVELTENVVNVERSQQYNMHFNPYERYWLYLRVDLDFISKGECEQFFDKYSDTFKLIFKECARIVEQTEQELLHEFQYSELYLVYCTTYCNKAAKIKPIELPENLSYYINQAKLYW